MATASDYSPLPPGRVALEPGERALCTFRIRGYVWGVGRPDPEPRAFLGHLTDRRFVLEPDDPAREVFAVAWADVIEFEQIAGTRALERLAGAEDEMIHMVTKGPSPVDRDELFLFFAEPVAGAKPADRARHCAAFMERADEALLDAFEG